MARPLLLAVRRAWIGAEITAIGPAGLLELLAEDAAWDRAWSQPLAGGDAASANASRFDTALVLPPSFSSAWQAWRLGARVRVGFAGDWRSAFLTAAVRRPARGDQHLSREYLALGAAAGVAGPFEEPAPLRVRLAASPLSGEAAPYAVLAPGAAYGPAKRWPLERFASLGNALALRGLKVVVCGAAAEAGACDELAGRTSSASFAGRTNLIQQAAICAGAAVVVSNDSGMAHLAGAVGAPTVAVFGSTSSAWTAPLGRRVRVVQRATVCSPCFQRTCRIGYSCLTAVSVSAVMDAVEELGALRREGIA